RRWCAGECYERPSPPTVQVSCDLTPELATCRPRWDPVRPRCLSVDRKGDAPLRVAAPREATWRQPPRITDRTAGLATAGQWGERRGAASTGMDEVEGWRRIAPTTMATTLRAFVVAVKLKRAHRTATIKAQFRSTEAPAVRRSIQDQSNIIICSAFFNTRF